MALPENRLIRVLYRGISSLFASLSTIFLRIYQSTLEIETEGLEHLLLAKARKQNIIIAFWHTFVDAAVFTFHSRNFLIYSDHPRTREYETSLAHFFRETGIKTIKGYEYNILDASLGKQSAGILRFISAIKNGAPAMIAPDGPDGPIYRAKPGAAYIARKTDAIIIPVGFGFSKKISGPNWDDFALPVPFSKISVMIGEPITGCDQSNQDETTKLLEETLDTLTFKAQKAIDNR